MSTLLRIRALAASTALVVLLTPIAASAQGSSDTRFDDHGLNQPPSAGSCNSTNWTPGNTQQRSCTTDFAAVPLEASTAGANGSLTAHARADGSSPQYMDNHNFQATAYNYWSDAITWSWGTAVPTRLFFEVMVSGAATAWSGSDWSGGYADWSFWLTPHTNTLYNVGISWSDAASVYTGTVSRPTSRNETLEFNVEGQNSFSYSAQLMARGNASGHIYGVESGGETDIVYELRRLWFEDADGNDVTGQIGWSSNHGTEPTASATPEPLSLLLLGSGLAGVAGARRRRRRD